MTYKVVPPYHTVEVTISIEQGLLLPANPLVNFIIECALARAQHLYPLEINHYIIEQTHIHFMAYIEDPDLVPGFVERFKTESAHYINAMLGRKKRTVWCSDYFCAPILTMSSAKKKIRYIYTNPAKDGLEDSIEQYPGLSSWRAYRTGRVKKQCPRLHRPMIPHLPEKFYSEHTLKKHRRVLKRLSKTSHTLILSPDGWMKAFRVTDEVEVQRINETILEMIIERENHFREERKREGRGVIGREVLSAAHLDSDHMPTREGRKMWCICDDAELRIRYIAWAKGLKQKAREVYERWKQGDFSMKFPPGIFPPAVPKLSNMTGLSLCY